MDEKTRNAIALKKFSIIGPVLNGQVSNNAEYFRKVCNVTYRNALLWNAKLFLQNFRIMVV